MIYKTEIEDFHLFESYKERNLYYKIFGGYFFNEIVPGYETRISKFITLIADNRLEEERIYDPMKCADLIFSKLRNEKINVTFDYHTAQIFRDDKSKDRGEMSDVLITTKSCMISIECKFLSNFNIGKDIFSVQDRMRKFAKQFDLIPLQILLLKKDKWFYSGKIRSRIEQESTSKKDKIIAPIIVVFWEEVAELIDNSVVKEYLTKQLNRKLSIQLI